jgi:hypothetical protein
MKRALQTLLWILGILAASFPASFMVTFLLTPLWSWIEATYGIESIGHSGRRTGASGRSTGCLPPLCWPPTRVIAGKFRYPEWSLARSEPP